ncbi:hypothetical protein [Clostridioides difficile]|uniref:hypothetical protein n=1 Tax=Clostridioides difficile TaxID=1496 RepID=UPI000BB2FF67|nr:hypothetical protein [Clostridioides difficile]PBD74426.1 hypothetical protein BGU04_18960 [Clostridioides difficile]
MTGATGATGAAAAAILAATAQIGAAGAAVAVTEAGASRQNRETGTKRRPGRSVADGTSHRCD